ncbi:DNA mismatch repair protein MutT [Glutamicibacter creatinolyticus]|uniref:DNA mismatch repair protein MutT n=1 Tax=Glutamicibacter creatinolyticus TaxID=162496 RepID=A0A5B7WTT1_9MICC|nr:NUDIX domain-containing protein [Glutamicibacter creatinolyticus]QCY46650.1 DNA mismatch repair protein MutT [Glutamicibacter creatinolyticus]
MSLPPQDLPPARSGLIAVSYVIFRQADAVLLQQRRGTGFLDGYWGAAAAGHLENGENAVAAAIREAGEELGVLVCQEHLHPLTVLQRPAAVKDQPGRVDFFFECRTWQGTPEIQEPDKAVDLRWFGLDDLPIPVVPHEKVVLEQLRLPLPAFTCLVP